MSQLADSIRNYSSNLSAFAAPVIGQVTQGMARTMPGGAIGEVLSSKLLAQSAQTLTQPPTYIPQTFAQAPQTSSVPPPQLPPAQVPPTFTPPQPFAMQPTLYQQPQTPYLPPNTSFPTTAPYQASSFLDAAAPLTTAAASSMGGGDPVTTAKFKQLEDALSQRTSQIEELKRIIASGRDGISNRIIPDISTLTEDINSIVTGLGGNASGGGGILGGKTGGMSRTVKIIIIVVCVILGLLIIGGLIGLGVYLWRKRKQTAADEAANLGAGVSAAGAPVSVVL